MCYCRGPGSEPVPVLLALWGSLMWARISPGNAHRVHHSHGLWDSSWHQFPVQFVLVPILSSVSASLCVSELTKKTGNPKVFWAWETWKQITWKNPMLITYLTCPVPSRFKDLQGVLPGIDILVFMELSSAVCEIRQGALSPEFVSDTKFKV